MLITQLIFLSFFLSDNTFAQEVDSSDRIDSLHRIVIVDDTIVSSIKVNKEEISEAVIFDDNHEFFIRKIEEINKEQWGILDSNIEKFILYKIFFNQKSKVHILSSCYQNLDNSLILSKYHDETFDINWWYDDTDLIIEPFDIHKY